MDKTTISVATINRAISNLQFLRDVRYNGESKEVKNMLQEAINVLVICGDIFDSTTAEPAADMVNEPPHYMQHAMECIDEMVEVFGVDAVIHYCMCNVWKYRYRAPFKSNAEEDNMKSDWYMHAIHDLKEYGRVHSFKIVKNDSKKSSDDI